MSKEGTSAFAPFEMFVTISREDAPRLYDDLVGLPKGRRRINRFRFLANQGLLVEMLSNVIAEKASKTEAKGAAGSAPNVLAFMRAMDLSLDEEGDGE